MSNELSFQKIATRFISNIYALRVFNIEIGNLAKQHDEKSMDSIIEGLADNLGIDKDELKTKIKESDPQSNEEENDEDDDLDNDLKASDRDETRKVLVDIDAKHPGFIMGLYKSLKLLRKKSPIQSLLLRQGALINLTIYFETLLSDLLHIYYSLFPAALPADDRVLSLADLREIGSITDAEKYLVDKEVDGILRENTKTQFDYFSKKLKVNIEVLAKHSSELFEIFQRRNIVVHNQGIVNKIYLQNVSKEIVEKQKIVDGSTIKVSEEYLNKAIDYIFLCGIILIQQCWRKWRKEELDLADSALIDATFESLIEKRYDIVNEIAGYAKDVNFEIDRSRRVVTINHAIALKQLHEAEKMEEVLSKHDWSSCSIEFEVALCALRNEEKKLVELLSRAIPAKAIKQDYLLDWPLFMEFRNSPEFEEFMVKHFPKT